IDEAILKQADASDAVGRLLLVADGKPERTAHSTHAQPLRSDRAMQLEGISAGQHIDRAAVLEVLPPTAARQRLLVIDQRTKPTSTTQRIPFHTDRAIHGIGLCTRFPINESRLEVLISPAVTHTSLVGDRITQGAFHAAQPEPFEPDVAMHFISVSIR